ncbi:MAG: hypothetical protein ACRDD1_07065 [Planctomycetia bacterium]
MNDESSRSLAEKYAGGGPRRPAEIAPTAPTATPDVETEEAGEDDGYRAFAVGPSSRPPMMLEFRRRNGDRFALGYGYLIRVDFNPSRGVVLEFTDGRVEVEGRRLEPLFHAVVGQRASRIVEIDEWQAEALPSGETVVTALREERRK